MLKYFEEEKILYDRFVARREKGWPVTYAWLRSTMKHILRERHIRGWTNRNFKNHWARNYCKRWSISRQKKTNKKHHSVTERTHLFKNHHWFQIYMSCDELPEDQEILSSDDEDLLLLLPSKERKEFKAKLRKEIKSWKKTDPQKWEEHLAIKKKQKQPIEVQEDCELEVAQLLAEMLTNSETESEEA